MLLVGKINQLSQRYKTFINYFITPLFNSHTKYEEICIIHVVHNEEI